MKAENKYFREKQDTTFSLSFTSCTEAKNGSYFSAYFVCIRVAHRARHTLMDLLPCCMLSCMEFFPTVDTVSSDVFPPA